MAVIECLLRNPCALLVSKFFICHKFKIFYPWLPAPLLLRLCNLMKLYCLYYLSDMKLEHLESEKQLILFLYMQ